MEEPNSETVGPAKPPRAAPWSAETRRWIIIALVLIGVWLLYQLSDILPTIIGALLLAYLVNPIVAYLERQRGLPRILAVATLYLVLVAVLIGAGLVLTPVLIREVRALSRELDRIVALLTQPGQAPLLNLPGFPVDSTMIADELRNEISALASVAPRLLIGAAAGVLRVVLVLVLSFYLLVEAEGIAKSIDRAIPDEYQDEWARIKGEFGRIWSSFLRGQVILAIIIGVVVTITLFVLGVPNAFFLGLLAGVLEVVPNVGPIISMIPAVLVALFQGSTHWAIDNTVFAIVVVVAYIVIQQLENHLIVPRVIGASVNLPPIVILIGALAGASLAGVLGIFLAAPVLATARLVLEFILRKLFEPEPPEVTA